MTTEQKAGYDFAVGVAGYLAHLAIVVGLVLCMLIVVWNFFGRGTDDTDRDGWNRSGLKVHTDHKTGVQYLSDGIGGLVRREQLAEYPRTQPVADGYLDGVCPKLHRALTITASGGWDGATVDSVETDANFGCVLFELNDTLCREAGQKDAR